MQPIKINLARDLILPAGKRCLYCRLIRIYLVIASAVFAWSCIHAYSNLVQAAEGYREIAIRQQRFLQAHPGVRSMADHADSLRIEIENRVRLAQTVHNALPGKVRTALPLLNYLVNRPEQSCLCRLSLQQESTRPALLEFGVFTPVNGRSSPDPVAFQSGKGNPVSTGFYEAVIPVKTSLESIRGEDVFLMNFKVVFKE